MYVIEFLDFGVGVKKSIFKDFMVGYHRMNNLFSFFFKNDYLNSGTPGLHYCVITFLIFLGVMPEC